MLIEGIALDIDKWEQLIDYNLKNKIYDEEIHELMSVEMDRITALYQYYINEVYKWVADTLSGKTGLIRSSILSRTLEFSARAVIVAEPALEAYEVEVSRKILFKLWQPYFLNFILTYKKDISFNEIFYDIVCGHYEDNKELFDEFIQWFEKN